MNEPMMRPDQGRGESVRRFAAPARATEDEEVRAVQEPTPRLGWTSLLRRAARLKPVSAG